jgi:hypothetical protein
LTTTSEGSNAASIAVLYAWGVELVAANGSCEQSIPVCSASEKEEGFAVIFWRRLWLFMERGDPHHKQEHQYDPIGNVSMADLYPSITQCAVVATAFKVLLFPA